MTPEEIARLPYRLGVGMMVLNPRGEVFVGRRIDTRVEAWQMPQGGIDEGEEPHVAALREVAEEGRAVDCSCRLQLWIAKL